MFRPGQIFKHRDTGEKSFLPDIIGLIIASLAGAGKVKYTLSCGDGLPISKLGSYSL
jgi:hypothetical protein